MSRYLSLALAVLTVGCTDRAPTGPNADLRVGSPEAAPSITVMTQNLYVGADVDAVIGALATPETTDDVPALLFAIQTLGNTDYPARAAAIADEIARQRPHVAGLQEVSVINIDLTGLGLPIVVHLDFLQILQAELAERGLHYTVAAQVRNIVAEPLPGISLVDHDAVLVDADRVTVTSAGGQNFALNVGVVAPGVELKRGWVWADVDIAGAPYRFVSAHAEADLAGNHLELLRAAQVSELVASLPTDRPVIVVGDLNDVPGSPMYQVLAGAGFTDAWATLRAGLVGYTCCQLADLSNPMPTLDERIDYVLARGIGVLGRIDRFGDVPADRTAGPAYPIWPSDHVGVSATLILRP
jgi:hypothetical protein